MVSSLEIAQATDSWSADDRETKKVGFKERDGEADVEMVVDLDSQPQVSWKQMLLEKGVLNQEEGSRSSKVECTEGFEFLEGDVIKDCQWYSDYRVFGLYTTNFDRGYGSNSVLVNGELQRVEYEALPTICFLYGKYGHLKEMCHSSATDKGNDTRKICGNSDLTESMISEAGFRPEVTFGKIKEIINQSKVSGGPSSRTNGASCKSKLGEFQFKGDSRFRPKTQEETDMGLRSVETELAVTDLGVNKQLENSFSDPSKFSNSSSNSNMTITHFNPTFEESEGAVVVLDRNVLDLGKHSTIVFKEAPSSKKGQVLGDGGNYGVGKEVFIPKVRGSSDKYGTS
ncbi:hypothetical protein ES332_D08G186500v1 [Gossypium tomentosum]|uniref:Zinc knuckle CX2CX4HX4C domain-containing protein n=1 Tax=Gossypium tomentosum TaxID=34277 RepID=A0A5D2JWN6_GOSTO|nr:hypothetical protein ES332_D08G186500v1 [Gossypium tomentosum]